MTCVMHRADGSTPISAETGRASAMRETVMAARAGAKKAAGGEHETAVDT